jgi:hypothetical protein
MTDPSDPWPSGTPGARKSERAQLSIEVMLRRAGQHSYKVRMFDLSPEGCKAEFVERPKLGEHVWVKFEGLEALEAIVCWVEGFQVGLKFEMPIHQAVFDMLITRLAK